MAREKKNWYALDEGWGSGDASKASVRVARREAVRSGSKFVQVFDKNDNFKGTVINNKKLGVSYWNTVTKKGRSVNYIVGKDGSLVGYAGKKSQRRNDRTIDALDPVYEGRKKYKPRTTKRGKKYDFAWDFEE